ncbi:DUF6279 family lipoprotein [Marinobacter shengliensis]|uniref:DUF6279 family lipoprotein n=1 Tax=Marinobacter shengliensis TaxID=1389223 RepID=A0ABV4W401_9GAMM|nr:DUF6279 family lipoprotein [Marinobacter shengliensis]
MDQRHRTKPLKLTTLSLVALFVLAGCSSTRMAYRYADWGVVWWVEDYVTLSRAQKQLLNQDLDSLRQWHCSTELPRYRAWLDELEADIADGAPDIDTIEYHQQQLLVFVPDLLDRAVPVAVNLLASLSDGQVTELARNMAEDQSELEQEMLAGDPQQTAKARAERTAKRVERWLGSLNGQQQALVEEWSADRGRQTEIWLQGRENWQQALLETLENRGQPGFEGAIRELVVNSEKARGPEYQAMMTESQQAMANLMHELIQAGDQQHREHLQARASKLNQDFTALTCS